MISFAAGLLASFLTSAETVWDSMIERPASTSTPAKMIANPTVISALRRRPVARKIASA